MPESNEPDWYLREWAERLGKRQADMVRDLGLMKNSANRIWHGQQPYKRDLVNRIAAWLGIEPYELLMPPTRAMALRRIREHAAEIVGEDEASFDMDVDPRLSRR